MRGIETDELLAAVPNRPDEMDMVNRCFLVEHPKGRLLWDTGFPHSLRYALMRIGFSIMNLGQSGVEQGDELPEQLSALGLDPADIDYLALSHVHWDHAGGSKHFVRSTWLVQRAELDWAFSDADIERPHVDSELYAAIEAADKVVLEGSRRLRRRNCGDPLGAGSHSRTPVPLHRSSRVGFDRAFGRSLPQ